MNNNFSNNSNNAPVSKTDKMLESMRNAVIDEQRCKAIALKLTQYIKQK